MEEQTAVSFILDQTAIESEDLETSSLTMKEEFPLNLKGVLHSRQ